MGGRDIQGSAETAVFRGSWVCICLRMALLRGRRCLKYRHFLFSEKFSPLGHFVGFVGKEKKNLVTVKGLSFPFSHQVLGNSGFFLSFRSRLLGLEKEKSRCCEGCRMKRGQVRGFAEE